MAEQNYEQHLFSQSKIYELETVISIRDNKIADLLEVIREADDTIKGYETQTSVLETTIKQHEDKIVTLEARVSELETYEASLRAKEEAERIREEVRTPSDGLLLTLDEDDELEPATPSRCPRPSIGQWSENRRRNNLSVRSLVTSLEKTQRRPQPVPRKL